MKVRRGMVPQIYLNNDSVESRYFRHELNYA
jgi:hypothetical protein